MRHARPRSSIVCLSFTGIPCSAQAFSYRFNHTFITIMSYEHILHSPSCNVFQRLLGTDCFVHRLQMGNVHSKILLTKLCYLGILAPEHYVSIPITQSHVKRFQCSTPLYNCILCVHVSVRFTITNHITIYVIFYAKMIVFILIF